MKNLKSFYIILFLCIVFVGCKKNPLSDNTYIRDFSFNYGIYKIEFDSNKGLKLFGGEKTFFDSNSSPYWIKNTNIKIDKKNRNFIVYDEEKKDKPIDIGFYSENGDSLYFGDRLNAVDFLNLDEKESNSHEKVYCNYDYGIFKIKICDDGTFYSYKKYSWETEPSSWEKIGNISFIDSIFNFTVVNTYYDEKEEYSTNLGFGFFSSNKKNIYFYNATAEIFNKNKISLDSVDFYGLSLTSTRSDFLSSYPQAQLKNTELLSSIKKTERQYLVSNLELSNYMWFVFHDDELESISQVIWSSDSFSILQRKINELTEKYGKPEVTETADSSNTLTSKNYVWKGEAVIIIIYTQNYDKYGNYSDSLMISYSNKKVANSLY